MSVRALEVLRVAWQAANRQRQSQVPVADRTRRCIGEHLNTRSHNTVRHRRLHRLREVDTTQP